MTDSDMKKALERIKNIEPDSNTTESDSNETQLSINRRKKEYNEDTDEKQEDKNVEINLESTINNPEEKDTEKQPTPKKQKIKKTFSFIETIVKDIYHGNTITELNYKNLLLQKYNSRLLNTNIYYMCFRIPNNRWLIFKIDKVNIHKMSPFVKCKIYNTSLPEDIQNNPSYKKLRNQVQDKTTKIQTIYFNRDNYNFEQPMKNILKQYLFYQ